MNYPIIVSLLRGIIFFLEILSWLIVINSILSFFVSPRYRLKMMLSRFTEHFVSPFRHLLRRYQSSTLPLDFSPMLAIIAIWVVKEIIWRVMISIVY